MTALLDQFQSHMQRLPLIAILRGLQPEEALAIGQAPQPAGASKMKIGNSLISYYGIFIVFSFNTKFFRFICI